MVKRTVLSDNQLRPTSAEGVIYHVCRAADWELALAAGVYNGSSDDQRDGFIHFSTPAQLRSSVTKHRANQTNLVLLAVDSAYLGDALKWEKARGGQLFPHLYGSLDPAKVHKSAPLPLMQIGKHRFPKDIP